MESSGGMVCWGIAMLMETIPECDSWFFPNFQFCFKYYVLI